MKYIKIGNKKIGDNFPTFIIAEAGVNHNGSLKIAKKLVDIACDANVDAIKFQSFKSDKVATPKLEVVSYQRKNIGIKQTQINMLKKLELKHKDFLEIKKYCDKKNIIFLSTPHSYEEIDFLNNLIPAYKFGSGDLTNKPFLVKAAKKNKPIILGTGMATLSEVKKSFNWIKENGNNKIICLHCTTSYPCSIEDINLKAMVSIKKKLDCIVGYSDHSLGILVPIVATSLGANVIEKHFTINRNLKGPDHKASLEPNELKKMVGEIRKVEMIFGSEIKKPTDYEKKIKKEIRKSIVAENNIKKGEKITVDNIVIKRPEGGIKPEFYEEIIGKVLLKDIQKNDFIKDKDLK